MMSLLYYKLYLQKMEEKSIKMHHLLELLCLFRKTIDKIGKVNANFHVLY